MRWHQNFQIQYRLIQHLSQILHQPVQVLTSPLHGHVLHIRMEALPISACLNKYDVIYIEVPLFLYHLTALLDTQDYGNRLYHTEDILVAKCPMSRFYPRQLDSD
ncbi:hypothetical protein D3C78_1323940 [compost metagenome]